MYVMSCIGPDICCAVEIVSHYHSNEGLQYQIVVKIILKYLRKTRIYMLVYPGEDLILIGYIDSDRDSRKSTSSSIFTLGGRIIIRNGIKQSYFANLTKEAEYVATYEVSKESV